MKRLLTATVILLTLVGCKEQIDTSSRYVFNTKTITEYLEGKDYYSEYVRLLGKRPVSKYSQTTVLQLLSARGHYTVFAPTNDAVQAYLKSLYEKGIISEPSWDGFTKEWDGFTKEEVLDSIEKVIVFNSILDSGDQEAYDIAAFPEHEHEFGQANMNNRKLRVFYGQEDLDEISIGEEAPVSKTNRGIVLSNGFIHQVEGVVAPSNKRLGDFIRTWANHYDSGYNVMARLLIACGLQETVNAYRDETWEDLFLEGKVEDLRKHPTQGQVGTIPEHRFYGFTLFAETDQFWEETLGKKTEEITVEDVCNYLHESHFFDYVQGTLYNEDYTNEMNVLNQFVTYHLLNQRIGREKLVIHYNEIAYTYPTSTRPTIPIMDYYQTMGLPRLIKTYESRESQGIYLNRFPVLKNGRGEFGPSRGNENNYHESGLFPPLRGVGTTAEENQGIRVLTSTEAGTDASSIANAIVYPLEQLLVCTENVCNQLANQRIRIDVGCMMPELMNNDIRSHRDYYSYGSSNCRGFPTNYPYIENIEIREGTDFFYLPGYKSGYHNLQGDEFNIIGQYDFTMKLPPVPRSGEYEIRFGVATGSYYRSMAQVYFGAEREKMPAVGIPLDLRVGGLTKRMGGANRISEPSEVGWEADSGDDEYDDLVTKRMRTKGFMKAPNSWTNEMGAGADKSVRAQDIISRRILVRTYLSPYKNYYIRFKSVLDDNDKEFFMDYFEYVTKEVYDNPEELEDIW